MSTLFFIFLVLIISYFLRYLYMKYFPIIKTKVSNVVIVDRFKIERKVIETATKERLDTDIEEFNEECRDNTLTNYHINGRLLDKQHLL